MLTSFAMCSYFACCFMNLKHYLHWYLSRIISWYCSKVNTILTSKILYIKIFSNLTHLCESDLPECMYPLFFLSQPQIYILPYTRLFFSTYDTACWSNEPCYLFFWILPLILLLDSRLRLLLQTIWVIHHLCWL